MPTMQRDVVLRWIEEISRVIRRLLYGRGDVDLAQAASLVDDATARLLGPLATLVPRLEPGGAADLLHDPDRIYAYAQLLALQSAVEQARNAAEHTTTRDRALAFAAEAVSRHPEPPTEWEQWLSDAKEGTSA
ncbi:MAG TPA: hypothetical protein VF862_04125 [Gemmatimonadales bacterium]